MKLEHVGKRKTPHTHAAPMCWLEIPSLDYLMEIEKLCKVKSASLLVCKNL